MVSHTEDDIKTYTIGYHSKLIKQKKIDIWH